MAEESSKDGALREAGDSICGEYIVIARRYRPQSFDQLVGQQHVAHGLAAAIAASRVGHAYLFTGARGTGKTSTARILAKALNCEHGPTPTPCNECDICHSITSGDDMDVLEIDGASNRGIDEIRQLRQNVNVRPSRARFKIYIIDEVHMLTEPAFNALLKTLEEPPEHVKFIFCTTEPEKIPITILSRCQRFDFAGIQAGQIIDRLRQIVAQEQVEAEPEALEVLARRAAGSMRDSQSLLEQLLAFGSRRITVADVNNLLGAAGTERIARLVDELIRRNAAEALAELDRAVSDGVDVGQLLNQLLGYFRDVMAAAAGCSPDAFLHVSAGQQRDVQEAARQLGLQSTLIFLQILDQTISRLKYLNYPRTVTEMALVRICSLEDVDSIPKLISQLRDGSHPRTAASTAPASSDRSAAGAASPSPLSPPGASKKKYEPAMTPATTCANGSSIGAHGAIASNGSQTDASMMAVPSPPLAAHNSTPADRNPAASTTQLGKLSSESLLALWREVAEKLGGLAGEKASQSTAVAITAPNQLAVTFPKRYNFCKQFCERPEVAAQLAGILAELAGVSCRLSFQLAEEEHQAFCEPEKATNLRQRMYQACQRPFVRQAIELFNASPQRFEEPNPVRP